MEVQPKLPNPEQPLRCPGRSAGLFAACHSRAVRSPRLPDGVANWNSQPLVSTLNSYDAQVTSNSLIPPAGAGGAVSAFVTGTTHLILDISGFFAP